MNSPSPKFELEVQKTNYGYLQSSHYTHPDLYDESIVDLDSPFVTIDSKTKIFTFLFLGDQNAGKSTFLHAFTHLDDLNFFELVAEITILASSFFNTRFVEKREYIDELPFIDTDIARATLLMTLEDFDFFLEEHKLPPEPVLSSSQYVILQFLEYGGDHLDQLLQNKNWPAHLEFEMEKSKELLKTAQKSIYFINMKQLLQDLSDRAYDGISNLIKKLTYLNTIFPSSHEILIYVSRVPSNFKPAHFLKAMQTYIEDQYGLEFPEMEEITLKNIIAAMLQLLKSSNHWQFHFSDILIYPHLNLDGSIHVNNLLQTLIYLLKRNMTQFSTESDSFAVKYLTSFHVQLLKRLPRNIPWITQLSFQEYLRTIEFSDIPPPTLLDKFESIINHLSQSGFGISFYNPINIIYTIENESEIYKTLPTQQEISFRFPLFKPFFQFLQTYILADSGQQFRVQDQAVHWTKKLLNKLDSIQNKLENYIIAQFHDLIFHQSYVIDNLLADWMLTKIILLTQKQIPDTFVFPSNITISTKIIDYFQLQSQSTIQVDNSKYSKSNQFSKPKTISVILKRKDDI